MEMGSSVSFWVSSLKSASRCQKPVSADPAHATNLKGIGTWPTSPSFPTISTLAVLLTDSSIAAEDFPMIRQRLTNTRNLQSNAIQTLEREKGAKFRDRFRSKWEIMPIKLSKRVHHSTIPTWPRRPSNTTPSWDAWIRPQAPLLLPFVGHYHRQLNLLQLSLGHLG